MKGKIRFTDYAEYQIRERNIDPEDVKKVLKSPGQVLPGNKNRKIAQAEFVKDGQEGLLRIIFEENEENIRLVITAYWTSKVDKYWRWT